MENDIVRMLFLRRQRQKKRWKIKTISGAPPLSFKAKAGALKDYRIYGNTVDGESVGDLETTGEHAGEYKVPVTVEGKNLLQNTATSQTINGVTFTVNSDGSIVCDGQASTSTAVFIFSNFLVPSGTYILAGCPDGGSERKTYKLLLFINGEWFANDMGSGANFTLTKTSTVSVRIDIYNGYTCDNLTFYPMIRKADIEDDTYEPYHAPVTTPIYLPEPLKMVGDEAEYISYDDQKLHRIGVEDIDVTLPELPTLAGTNVLTVGTAVQPSGVEITGRIKKGE